MDFKTVQHNGRGSLVSEKVGILRLLSDGDKLMQRVEVRLLNDEVNRNNWRYENLEQHRKLFANTPILTAYVGDQIGDGHNFEEKKNPDGTVTASFMAATAERIVGYFQNEEDIRIEVIDGKTWVIGKGFIWKWYAQELVKKINEQGVEGMSISIETLIDEMHIDGTTEVFTKYQILGTTILGDSVTPAVADANIRALNAIGANAVRDMTLRVASAQTANKPQKSKNHKGANKMKVSELSGKFSGMTVLAVNGDDVALLSANGAAVLATATKNGDEITEGEHVDATVEDVVFANGEKTVSVPFDTITDSLVSRINALQADLDAERAKTTTAEQTIEKMKNLEHARRKEAVLTAITTHFAEIRANGGCEFAADYCDELKADEKVEGYCGIEDTEGKFIGDKKACDDVDAHCMSKILEANAQKKLAQNAVFILDKTGAKQQAKVDDISATIANILK